MQNNTLLIVGSIAIDSIETPFDSRKNILGGSTTYSLLVSGENVPTSIVGIVGNDFPKEGMKIFKKYSNNLDDLIISKGKTFSWGGKYLKNWDDRETLFTDLGAFEDFKPVLSKSNQNHSHIFLANIHPDLQQLVIDQSLNSSKIIAIDTMNLWIDIAKDSLHNVLSSSDILFINESEASLLSGKKTIYDSASLFLDLGLKIVVVKKGGQGAELFSNEENIKIGAYKVNVVDPTGAGDVFGGAFISTLAQGGTLSDSLINGSAMASFCVQGFGTSCILNVSEGEFEHRKSNLYSTLSS